MKALSERNDSPATASRPFDRDRDGFVMGEGAGIVILEELEHAKRRGARIYAEVAGDGAQRAMRRALQDAGLSAADVQYVNAHGTSTPANDLNETRAIKAVFGESAAALNVSSTKSCTGHMLGAAGSVEFIVCSMVIQDGTIPPTINYQNPDPDLNLNYTPNASVQRQVTAALSNSFGFGGHNVSLAIRRFSE